MPAAESTHLSRVLRLAVGSAVEVFDGRGTAMDGVVASASATAAVVRLGERRMAAPEPPARIEIVQALLKGDAMDAVVRDATVLGASLIRPVTTARTNVPPRAARGALERWQRVAVAAAKQCGRATLPAIAPVEPLVHVLPRARESGATCLLLVEPSLTVDDGSGTPPSEQPLWLAIGPEGGWTVEEVERARAETWRPWSLAPVTLRAEHVTLAALSVVRYAWDAARRRIT